MGMNPAFRRLCLGVRCTGASGADAQDGVLLPVLGSMVPARPRKFRLAPHSRAELPEQWRWPLERPSWQRASRCSASRARQP